MFILFALLLMLLALGALDEMRYADGQRTSRPSPQVDTAHRHDPARGWMR